MTTLDHAIRTTLSYSDYFSFPLTASEIHVRLISSAPCDKKQVFATLQSMVKKNLIQRTGMYYHLPGRTHLAASRARRARLSQPLYERAVTLAQTIGARWGVEAILLTGSLAMRNTDGADDIDYMIVTKEGRLWTTRFFLTIYTSLRGIRRTPLSSNNAGKLCLNLYMSPSGFSLPQDRRSLYTAYELIQAEPLYDPHHLRARLLASNPWISDYLPNYSVPKRVVLSRSEGTTLTFISLIESFFYNLQYLYMRRHMTREYVTPHSAFFHPASPGDKVLERVVPSSKMKAQP